MVYAMETRGGSADAEAEIEQEGQEVSEPETQEPSEQQAESESTEEPANEKGTNRITRTESEESETAPTSEPEEPQGEKPADTKSEVSESKEDTQDFSETQPESEPSTSSEDQHTTGEVSEYEEEQAESTMETDTESSESDTGSSSLEHDIEVPPETSEDSHPELTAQEDSEVKAEQESVEHEREFVEPEAESQEQEHTFEDETLPEDLEDFVRRVKDILDDKMDADDGYDYVQDPLTGKIQRVPKILAEYESDEQKQRRKRRNLFAELSEEERERFKELVCEDERSAEAVEQAWGQVVEKAEQERTELLEKVREVFTDPEVMQLLERMSVAEEDKKGRTGIESAEVDEMDEDESTEQFLTRGESRLKLWIPRVNGERVESIEQLEQIIGEQYTGLMKHKDYIKYLRQAKLHLELVQRFQNEILKRGDIARIAKETGQSPVTVKRWLIEGAKPRVYHYLNRNPLEDRAERVAKLLSALNGITDMETLERRLKTLFLYKALEQSKKHAENLERARLFFQFLEKYVEGGILKSIAKRMKIGKSTISEWFSGSQLPSYVRMAVEIPSESPEFGKKWLPLWLNSQTNLPEQFIQIPQTVTSEEDLLSVLRQLRSLRTPKMKGFEEKHERESVPLAFMYLLGLIVSDGEFKSDSDLSTRVVLSASKKYHWSLRLGGAFSYAMGRIGFNIERRADDIRVRDGKTIVCHMWGSRASPLLRWVKEVLLGLKPTHSKKQTPIDAEWILNLPHDYRIAFLQGLADGDGYASIKAFRVGIASKPNREFIKRLLSTFEIHSKIDKTKVVVKKHEDILKANGLPLFRHATSRKKNHDELSKIIGLLDGGHGKVPEKERKIIIELHKRGLSPGEITEKLWFEYRFARSTSSIQRIVRRYKRNQSL